MQLKPDCVRDVLLFLEENLTLVRGQNKRHSIQTISTGALGKDEKMIGKYSYEDIFYTVTKLHEAKLIKATSFGGVNILYFEIEDITWSGHEFIGNVRNHGIWEHTKACAKKIGITSMKGLWSLSSQIIAAIVSDPIVIQSIVQKLGE